MEEKNYKSIIEAILFTMGESVELGKIAEAIELEGRTVTVTGENLNVNISERYFKSFSSKIILHTPNNLNPVFKTIDK